MLWEDYFGNISLDILVSGTKQWEWYNIPGTESGSMSLEVIQWKYSILKSTVKINGMLKDI